MKNERIYFPNLNGLRFIAAFLVIIHHIEQIKKFLNIGDSFFKVPFISIIGKLGVVLFFVLSGFLITYLLLSEEKSFKSISIQKFYMRRILRIWPLYFLIIILAFLVLPYIKLFEITGLGNEVVFNNLGMKLLLFAFFFPNLVLSFYGIVPYASHTWSIGTEEQFYLFWPWLLKHFKKNRIFIMLIIIVFYRLISGFLNTSFSDFLVYKKIIASIWACFNFDCMSIGGIFAVLLFQKNKFLILLKNNFFFYFTLVLVIIMIVNGVFIPHINYELYSILFGIIILNFASNEIMKISLENTIFNFLGNISYGLYMFHPIGIVLALTICKSTNLISNWFIYPLSLLLTISIAWFSYNYFEKYFLKFKPKFSKVISGNETKL